MSKTKLFTFGECINHATLLKVFSELLLLRLGCLIVGHVIYININTVAFVLYIKATHRKLYRNKKQIFKDVVVSFFFQKIFKRHNPIFQSATSHDVPPGPDQQLMIINTVEVCVCPSHPSNFLQNMASRDLELAKTSYDLRDVEASVIAHNAKRYERTNDDEIAPEIHRFKKLYNSLAVLYWH